MAVMKVSTVERPVASAGYSFVWFIGGAIAPWPAGKLSEWYSPHIPFYAGAGAEVISEVCGIFHQPHTHAIRNFKGQLNYHFRLQSERGRGPIVQVVVRGG
jgi:hypothetical protein